MDLIDRAAVEKIIDDLLENDNLQASPSVWHGLHMIKQLPSAQPVVKDTNVPSNDTISRRAAIDAECEVCQIAPKKERGHNCTYYVHGCKEIECLRALPSAQPEVPDFVEWRACETCRYNGLNWDDEPCDSCTNGGDNNHWKPSAQPERKKGEWIKMPYHVTECSECGFSLEDWIQGAFYNYCPNCGADMRGEQHVPDE